MSYNLPRAVPELPTPALLIDLDALESNIRTMQRRADGLGVRLRPHIKTHKCLEIAELQRAGGASGITVSTLEEAHAFAAGGFDDVTWAFPLNPSRLDEALDLAGEIDFGVTIDSELALEALERAGRPAGVWIEIDTGYGRSGLSPTSPLALTLARRIADSGSLTLRGVLTHAGHTYRVAPAEIAAIAEEERARTVAFRDRLASEGLPAGTLSVGSTPGMSRVRSLDGIDEVRPGNYALYDYTQVRLGSCRLEDCAATVLASVVSAQPGRDRCVADCGALALSKDLGPDRDPAHYGRICTDLEGRVLEPEARVVSVSQEHAVLSTWKAVGSKIRVLPNHACLTVAHFDDCFVVRGNEVLDRWKIWRSRGPLPGPVRQPTSR